MPSPASPLTLIVRRRPVTRPVMTVSESVPPALPTTVTDCPIRAVEEFPNRAGWSPRGFLICSKAMSFETLKPRTLAENVGPEGSSIWIALAPPMTWWLVSTNPDRERTIPVPVAVPVFTMTTPVRGLESPSAPQPVQPHATSATAETVPASAPDRRFQRFTPIAGHVATCRV